MASHQQASQTVPSMRAKNNQVSTPGFNLVRNVFDQAVGRALDKHRVDCNTTLLYLGLRRR